MYTQLRLSHVALNPELALGVLPSRQLCLLSSAQAEDDPTITRLIFPVAAADVCDLTRDLYSHGFGHKVVLSGFAVKPQLTYIKLRDPELSEWDDVAALRRALHLDAQGSLVASALLHSVIRTDAPCLLVSSMAWEHSSGHYQAEAPRFSFDHLVGRSSPISVPLSRAIACSMRATIRSRAHGWSVVTAARPHATWRV